MYTFFFLGGGVTLYIVILMSNIIRWLVILVSFRADIFELVQIRASQFILIDTSHVFQLFVLYYKKDNSRHVVIGSVAWLPWSVVVYGHNVPAM